MKYTENDYIQAGYKFERGQVQAETLRRMIESEHIDDRAEARHLIEQGRQEARAMDSRWPFPVAPIPVDRRRPPPRQPDPEPAPW